MASAVTVYRYSVQPFSQQVEGKQYTGAEAGFEQCGICCRKTRRDRKTCGIVIDGGATWGDEQSEQNSGYMGCWPIGPDCHRKYVVKGGN